MNFLNVPWHDMFVPSQSVVEVVLRGSLMYLAIFAVLRVLRRRQPGGLAISDLLVLVLIADASQQGMAGQYMSITEGVILVLTIVAWAFVLDWLAFKFHPMARLIYRSSTVLMRDGRLVPEAVERELVTQEELRSALRQQGVWDLSEVEEVRMESNGAISVRSRKLPAGPKSQMPGPAGSPGPGVP